MKKVLFVCLGNICRSPLGEGILKDMVNKLNIESQFQIDSCGTSAFHVGNPPDTRMQETAYNHGVLLTSKARQLQPSDLNEFDYILAMDNQNLKDTLSLNTGNHRANITLMRDFDNKHPGTDVPDPYYGGISGFEEVYTILEHCCENFLKKTCHENNI